VPGEYTPAEFKALLAKKALNAPGELRDAVGDMVDVMVETIRAEEPKLSGFMASQTRGDTAQLSPTEVEGIAGVLKSAPQAGWLTHGTGIYGARGTPIVPVRAHALRFELGGKIVFRGSVKGTPKDDFFERAVDAVDRSYVPERLRQLGKSSTDLER
jgi:hypothetical protein